MDNLKIKEQNLVVHKRDYKLPFVFWFLGGDSCIFVAGVGVLSVCGQYNELYYLFDN